MVEKIFGLVFLVAALFFAWKFTSMPSSTPANKKKSAASSALAPPKTSTNTITGEENEDPDSQIVANIKNLLDDQVELVGLSENIQRISFKTHLNSKKLNSSIAQSLNKIASQSTNAPYMLEAEVFDTTGPQDQRSRKSLPDPIVFQFSVYDVKTQNKVGEFGASYHLDIVAPELAELILDKKKPDETHASSGSK